MRFPVIVADPPWLFEAWAKGGNRHPDNHYACSHSDWIASLPVKQIASPNCVLFTWTCWSHLPEALKVIEA